MFELFIKEKRFVQNASPNTIDFYKRGHQAFVKHGLNIEQLSKVHLLEVVSKMREGGMSANCCDAYIRAINPYLTWLFENEVTDQHWKVPRIKFGQRVLKTFTDAQVKAILNHKPANWYEKRLHCLLLLLLDTGVRINEALTLRRDGVDLDNLLISVIGKGNKERIVPYSIELRKTLYKFLKSHKHDLVFPNRFGGKLSKDNMRRDFQKLAADLGITGFDGSFHAFRRCFATNYIKENGNPLKLQRMLGHSTLAMTNRYVKLVTDDLSKEHNRTSLLNKFR